MTGLILAACVIVGLAANGLRLRSRVPADLSATAARDLLPDPQWPLAAAFGRSWMPWFQPQHQHMMPAGNLAAALTERGLCPVAVERAQAHQANDFVTAALLFNAYHVLARREDLAGAR